MYLACTRSLFLFVSIACALIIGATFYLQRTFGLDPCLLCMLQRIAMIGCGLLGLSAAWHAPGIAGWRRYATSVLLIAAFGAAAAGSQVWLQTATHDQLVPIVARLETVLSALSLHTWLVRLDSEIVFCAEINWSLCGFTLPEWSLLAFTGIMALACYPLFKGSSGRRYTEGRAKD
ncbi:disulfide bond formation protein B [Pseudomonas sp. v388]|uniref:disulfide bond formation protein B n=1 Tax=Pseudomonas sp. v388 TaxID=2479849 RepID=UPI000F773749|nr:disulfide bond formation protein B [Pseudomonas sp. v388]RRV09100.1 disulfide bond formation protein B [Pseudomonas sp. v388]